MVGGAVDLLQVSLANFSPLANRIQIAQLCLRELYEGMPGGAEEETSRRSSSLIFSY